MKLSSNHSIIDTNKSKIDDRGQPRDQAKGKCLPSLGGMLARHAPQLPKYDGALSMLFKGLGQLNAKKNMDQSGSARSKGPLNNALASLINNNRRNRTSIDVFNISTFPKGYNLDETVAQLEKSCVEDDQQDSKNELLPANLLDAIIEKPKRLSQYLGNSTIHKPSESYF